MAMLDFKDYNPDLDQKRLQDLIDSIENKGLPNKFNFANYGVHYNPIYDKRSHTVKSITQSGLSKEDYHNLIELMETSPELDEETILDNASKTAVRTLNTILGNNNDLTDEQIKEIIRSGYNNITPDQIQSFIDNYKEEIKRYNKDDSDFDYNMIKTFAGWIK